MPEVAPKRVRNVLSTNQDPAHILVVTDFDSGKFVFVLYLNYT